MTIKTLLARIRPPAAKSDPARNWLFAAAALLLCGGAALLNWSGAAFATPATAFVTEMPVPEAAFESIHVRALTDEEGEDPKVRITATEPTDVYVAHNTVAPGGNSGWHTHPGPSVVVIKTGTATVYDSDGRTCPATTYPAGTGFVDAGDGHVHLVQNAGTTTLETYAFQIIPAGAARRIDAPQPVNCPKL